MISRVFYLQISSQKLILNGVEVFMVNGLSAVVKDAKYEILG